MIRFSAVPISFIALLSLVMFSCEKPSDYNPDYKYEYFPKDTGRYVIYDVDSIRFDDFDQTIDSSHYQIKEVIESTFIDNEGRPTCRIERYRREDTLSPWKIIDVWFANRTFTKAEKAEENLRFIKLVFPLEEGLTWDGNVYIDIDPGLSFMENWEYTVTALDVPETINGLFFDSTVTILQEDFETLIEKIYSEERYAKHVGLIYKRLLFLEKQTISAPWTEPESGFILTMTISDYGKE